MPGLPFVRLAKSVDPQENAIIEAQNKFLAQQGAALNADLARPVDQDPRAWVEPNWDLGRAAPASVATPAQNGPPPAGNIITQQLAEQIKLVTAEHDRAVDGIKGSLDPEYNTLMAQAKIDYAAAVREGQDPQKVNDAYQKRWLTIESKVKPDIAKIGEVRQQTIAELESKAADLQSRVGEVQGMMDRNEITREVGLARQYHLVGRPELAPQPKPKPKEQEPMQRLGELRSLYSNQMSRAGDYRKIGGVWRVRDRSVPNAVKSIEKHYPTDASPEQIREAEDLVAQLPNVRAQIHALTSQLGRRNDLLASGMAPPSPAAQNVLAARNSGTQVGSIIERGGQRWVVTGVDMDGEPLVERAQ